MSVGPPTPDRALFEITVSEEEKPWPTGRKRKQHGVHLRRNGTITLSSVPGSVLNFAVLRASKDGDGGQAGGGEAGGGGDDGAALPAPAPAPAVALEIEHVYVPHSHRGQGHAEALVACAFRVAGEDYGSGCKVVPTCTYVRDTFLKRYPAFVEKTCARADVVGVMAAAGACRKKTKGKL